MVKQTLKNLAALTAKKILTCVLPFCERLTLEVKKIKFIEKIINI